VLTQILGSSAQPLEKVEALGASSLLFHQQNLRSLMLATLEPDRYKAGVSKFEPVLSLDLIVYFSLLIR
jgi:hypothetical protein